MALFSAMAEQLQELEEFQMASAKSELKRIEQCLKSPEHCSVQDMVTMMHHLERMDNECTEEGNQTNAECDVQFKEEREILMAKLSRRIAKSRTDVDKVKACLNSTEQPCSVDTMVTMLQDLEAVQFECTEEGNQTNTECDIDLKAEREALILKLSRRIAKSRTDVDKVKACLESPEPCSVDAMMAMLQDLEAVQFECTEEGNQTNTECDIDLKAEREALILKLSRRIAKSRTDVDKVKACLESPEQPCGVEAMITMLQDLESVQFECTEEGNQTNTECDIDLKAEREALILKLSRRIAKSRTDVDKVKACLESPEQPCGVAAMVTMLNDLEAVQFECTEEGNQTNTECDIDLKAEREALILKLSRRIAKSRTDVDKVKACLESPEPCGVEAMMTMLNDLEAVQFECTEEGNQTNSECDVEVKAEREALMLKLTRRIAKSRTDVDKVKAYLESPEPCSVDAMMTMLHDLEAVQNECTEEGNQTNTECDIDLKAERETLILKLSRRIAKSRTDVDQVKKCVEEPGLCSVHDMVTMLHDLEAVQFECTEEGNQTNTECDVMVKAEREALIEKLTLQIEMAQEQEILVHTVQDPTVAFMI